MGGEIGVMSMPGEGATFWFNVCLSRRDVQNKYDASDHEVLRNVRVLVVDDNSTNREIVCKHLSTWGIRHKDVPSGEAGLAALLDGADCHDSFGLIILDKHMPGMDGLEFARRTRADLNLQDVKMLMLSSVSPETETPLHEHGIGAHLTKPVRQSELYDSVLSLLSLRSKR